MFYLFDYPPRAPFKFLDLEGGALIRVGHLLTFCIYRVGAYSRLGINQINNGHFLIHLSMQLSQLLIF